MNNNNTHTKPQKWTEIWKQKTNKTKKKRKKKKAQTMQNKTDIYKNTIEFVLDWPAISDSWARSLFWSMWIYLVKLRCRTLIFPLPAGIIAVGFLGMSGIPHPLPFLTAGTSFGLNLCGPHASSLLSHVLHGLGWHGHSRLVPLTSIANQENVLWACLQRSLMETLSQLRFPLHPWL